MNCDGATGDNTTGGLPAAGVIATDVLCLCFADMTRGEWVRGGESVILHIAVCGYDEGRNG